VPFRLIDSSVWITYLRPKPHPQIVDAVRNALAAGEAAIAAPIVVEVLSGIRDCREYAARTADFRAMPRLDTGPEAPYIAARIGRALAEKGKKGRTVDLLLAGAAIEAGAELWSLPDDHFDDIRSLLKAGELKVAGALHLRWLP
jgi:predicted nucleic acid-binding protein